MEYILQDYFEWLTHQIRHDKPRRGNYEKLLFYLHNLEYTYTIPFDKNRSDDGENLRWYYKYDGGNSRILEWGASCTVLEMLVGLSWQMESIMENTEIDYSISYWFWKMIKNLKLDEMTNGKFNEDYIIEKIDIFINREYGPDGKGNIIFIRGCKDDIREVDVWTQMCWYLDTII